MAGEVYEKTAGNTYRLAGYRENGKFVRAAHPGPLRTLAQIPVSPPAPQQVDGDCMVYAAPDTLGRVLALRSNPGQVSEYAPVPVQEERLPGPRPLLTFAQAHGSTLDGVVTAQQRIGRQPASPATLHTMAVTPCERCGKDGSRCPCVPAAPQTLTHVVHRQAARRLVMEQAAVDSGLPETRKVVGMSS